MSGLVYNNEHFVLARKFGVSELEAVLEKAMSRDKDNKWTKKQSFAPSGLGYTGSCPRYWYYAFNGENFQYDTEPAALANMNAGTDSGARLAKMLDRAGILIDDEVEVNTIDSDEFPPIRGYIDAIVDWKGDEVVVEVKTCKSSTWNSRVATNSVPVYQLAQLLVYMYVTKHDKGFFMTENKDTHELFILPVKMTKEHREFVEGIFDWMRIVHKNALEGELPTRPFNKSSMQCKGCPVKETCWNGWTRGSVNGSDPNPGTITLPTLELKV
jgi:CRISPR/Cas system-associated exonuclease Cas4 (RecB family)